MEKSMKRNISVVLVALVCVIGNVNAANMKDVEAEKARVKKCKTDSADEFVENFLKKAAANTDGKYKVYVDEETKEITGFRYKAKILTRDSNRVFNSYKKFSNKVNASTNYKSTYKIKKCSKKWSKLIWTVKKK